MTIVMMCCYTVQIDNDQITWINQCGKHVMRVEEVWDIVGQGLVNTLVLNTLY